MQGEKQTQKLIGKIFNELADVLETGEYGAKARIGVTAVGSEHGEENVLNGAEIAKAKGIDVVAIGNSENNTTIKTVQATTEEEAHKAMEKLLSDGEIDAAVTMHYPFPIGVSTVGRVLTPGKGKQMYIATTTGTSSSDRIEGMVKNAIYGIITAKACGVKNPTVGILNVDGARQTEIALKKLQENGYDITFASSQRADGGAVMRGNDLLTGSADVMVTDPLTGNLMMKVFSAYTTGGNYESLGYGYGPGIGEGYDKLIMIISRASGAPVIAGAIEYAAQLVKGNYKKVAEEEFAKVNKAGLKKILSEMKAGKKETSSSEEVKAPPKEVVTAQIAGIEIMDLDDAVQKLWGTGIYAESGMGCTGPIVLVAEDKKENAMKTLAEAGYINQ
jgi:hypothetical protein